MIEWITLMVFTLTLGALVKDTRDTTQRREIEEQRRVVEHDGNIYTGEVDTGPRIQKFARYGSRSCSGVGYEDIGAYERNR